MASIAELERDITVARTRAGLSSAKVRGRIGSRPATPKDKINQDLKLYQAKDNDYSLKEISEMTGVSKSVFYRSLRDTML